MPNVHEKNIAVYESRTQWQVRERGQTVTHNLSIFRCSITHVAIGDAYKIYFETPPSLSRQRYKWVTLNSITLNWYEFNRFPLVEPYPLEVARWHLSLESRLSRWWQQAGQPERHDTPAHYRLLLSTGCARLLAIQSSLLRCMKKVRGHGLNFPRLLGQFSLNSFHSLP